ncbi:MAG: hypothetical protein OK457_08835, partial [Thaumarchaeota archaeon]|nr:hypothetical protein [Nitrososphaerota archaeon]
QFISSLLIACTRARKDSTLHIKNPETLVSKPYILATLAVLSWFGFRAEALESIDHEFTAFRIAGDQKVRGKKGFPVPGDMSSGASLVCAVLAARGEISLSNAGDEHFPQSDSAVVPLARKFGGALTKKGDRLSVSANRKVSPERFDLDLGDSPDLVPPMVGVSAATGSQVKIMNIGHLRFKESDRIETLAREMRKMGASIKEDRTSIEILSSKPSEQKEFRKPILLDPEKDHRMLIAFTIAGLSGKFGEIAIKDPDCVKKSYPDFVSDLQRLCHEKKTIRIAEL